MYFLRKKNDASRALEHFLCDIRSGGEVIIIRTNCGLEFEGSFQDLCLKYQIKTELTTHDSPQFNECAERGIAMIEVIIRAVRI